MRVKYFQSNSKINRKRNIAFDERRIARMSLPNVEQCLAVLTQLMANQNPAISVRAKIEKEIRFLTPFQGEPGTLPSFAASVTKVLTNYQREDDKRQVFEVIFDTKISGAAKNLLQADPPTDWSQCLNKLKQHFRASKDELTITKDIGVLRVRSIYELDYKIKDIVENIAEHATFSNNSKRITDIFHGMLIMKVKELVSGALAYAITGLHDLSEIRDKIRMFFGQDEGNLKSTFYNNSSVRNGYQNSNSNNHNRSGTYRNNPNNNSGTFRNNYGAYNNNNSRQNSNIPPRENNSGQYNFRNNTNSGQYSNNGIRQSNTNTNQYRNNPTNSGQEPMDTLSASYARRVNNIQTNSDFHSTSPQESYPI